MSLTDQPDQAEQLPGELAQLQGLAAAADAQLSGVDQAQPGVDQAAPAEADAHQSLAGFLVMVAGVVAMAVPPVGEAYTPQACATIATEYLRCAELYGWTFHKSAASPVVGLVAAVAMPAVMNLPAFMEWNAKRKQSDAAARAPAATPAVQLQAAETGEARSHAGVRL